MKKQKQQVQRVNNSSSEHSLKPIFSKEDKEKIQILDRIRKKDTGGTVTFHFSTERYNISQNKSYRQTWSQVLPLTPELLEQAPTKIFGHLVQIKNDLRAESFSIN